PSRCCSAATSASTATRSWPTSCARPAAGTGPTSCPTSPTGSRVCRDASRAVGSAAAQQEERPWALRDRLLADDLEPVAGRRAEPVERVVVEHVAARGEQAA